MKKLFILLALTIGLVGCNKKEETYSQSDSSFSSSSSSYSMKEEENVDLMQYLKIENVNMTFENGRVTLAGTITNTYSRTIDGYIGVTTYDSKGNITGSSLIALPVTGLEPNTSFEFKEGVTDKEVSTYKFSNETLTVE
jgi:uncharacterized lipoprotein NlpE involved in copper resistance